MSCVTGFLSVSAMKEVLSMAWQVGVDTTFLEFVTSCDGYRR